MYKFYLCLFLIFTFLLQADSIINLDRILYESDTNSNSKAIGHLAKKDIWIGFKSKSPSKEGLLALLFAFLSWFQFVSDEVNERITLNFYHIKMIRINIHVSFQLVGWIFF